MRYGHFSYEVNIGALCFVGFPQLWSICVHDSLVFYLWVRMGNTLVGSCGWLTHDR